MKTFVCLCMHMPTSPTKSTQPTHLHDLFQVLSGCTEAVEGEVLHNRVDPLTSRGHHTKSPPLHLPDVSIYTVEATRSGGWWQGLCGTHMRTYNVQAIRGTDS